MGEVERDTDEGRDRFVLNTPLTANDLVALIQYLVKGYMYHLHIHYALY